MHSYIVMHRLGKKIHVYDDIPGVEMYRRSIYHGPSKPTMFKGFYGLKKNCFLAGQNLHCSWVFGGSWLSILY